MWEYSLVKGYLRSGCFYFSLIFSVCSSSLQSPGSGAVISSHFANQRFSTRCLRPLRSLLGPGTRKFVRQISWSVVQGRHRSLYVWVSTLCSITVVDFSSLRYEPETYVRCEGLPSFAQFCALILAQEAALGLLGHVCLSRTTDVLGMC